MKKVQGFGISVLIGALLTGSPARAERWLVRGPTDASQKLSFGVRLEERGVQVLQTFKNVPWASVDGEAAALQQLQGEGVIERFEPDLPRYPSLARRASFPWVVALSALALLGCGGDEDDDGDQGPVQTSSWGWLKVRADQVTSRSTGRGIRVAVIDSGIDAEHPDLRVVAGKNFVPSGPAPGVREWDDCFGHGTHVAGIIGAQSNDFGVVGVAPEVDLYAARIFDCEGSAASVSSVLAALDWAVDQNVDVANMSFGAPSGSQAEEEAMAAAERSGVVLIAASGNRSILGAPAPMDYPAAYSSVLGVGATDESDQLADFSNQGPQLGITAPGVNILSSVVKGTAVTAAVKQGSREYDSLGLVFSGTGTVSGRLYSCGLALQASDCPSGVRGQIALVQRGQSFFSEKVTNAMSAGAKAVVIFNHLEDGDGGPVFGGTLQTDGDWVPTVTLSNADGVALRGRGDGLEIEVSVVAGDYDVLSGTSMAAPHVVGVAALLLAVERNLTPAQVRERLERGSVDLGVTGRDPRFGFGRLDAPGALGVASKADVSEAASETSQPVQGLGLKRPAL